MSEKWRLANKEREREKKIRFVSFLFVVLKFDLILFTSRYIEKNNITKNGKFKLTFCYLGNKVVCM